MMTLRYGFSRQSPLATITHTTLLLAGLLYLGGAQAQLAEDERSEHLPYGEQERPEPEPYAQQRSSSHATRVASQALLDQAILKPDLFIGKTVAFEDGEKIGPVLAVRRRLQDDGVYLIVDATAFFNSDTEYAVPAGDMRGIRDDRIVIREYTGMHLRGMEYYEEDYADL